jgi:hypothetical protein
VVVPAEAVRELLAETNLVFQRLELLEATIEATAAPLFKRLLSLKETTIRALGPTGPEVMSALAGYENMEKLEKLSLSFGAVPSLSGELIRGLGAIHSLTCLTLSGH